MKKDVDTCRAARQPIPLIFFGKPYEAWLKPTMGSLFLKLFLVNYVDEL
jgi:hypothetical protein